MPRYLVTCSSSDIRTQEVDAPTNAHAVQAAKDNPGAWEMQPRRETHSAVIIEQDFPFEQEKDVMPLNDGTNHGTNCDGKMCPDGCRHHG